MPPRLLPGSIVSSELLAYIVTTKYVDGLPLYRIENIFKRKGIRIPRQTMSNWIVRTGSKISDLIQVMFEEIRSGPLIQMDETSVQVLKEEDRPATSKSYMWVTVGYPDNKKIILYHYYPTRSKKVPLSILNGYNGYLQTDGYSAYNDCEKELEIIHVGCLAHARRKFTEVLKSGNKSENAEWIINEIKKIYVVENKLRGKLNQKEITKEKFEKERKKQSGSVLNIIKQRLDKLVNEVPPSTLLGTAINYSLSQWSKIIKYLDKWFLTPDNNCVENAIRPFVIGRKNWLFCNTPTGAYASAGLYSLIETAKANGFEPYIYLYYLFNELPKIDNKKDLKQLLPTQLRPSDLISLK
jgi:transposase